MRPLNKEEEAALHAFWKRDPVEFEKLLGGGSMRCSCGAYLRPDAKECPECEKPVSPPEVPKKGKWATQKEELKKLIAKIEKD